MKKANLFAVKHLSLVEQLLFSFGGFVITITASRVMSLEQFSEFIFFQSCSLLLAGLYNAIFCENSVRKLLSGLITKSDAAAHAFMGGLAVALPIIIIFVLKREFVGAIFSLGYMLLNIMWSLRKIGYASGKIPVIDSLIYTIFTSILCLVSLIYTSYALICMALVIPSLIVVIFRSEISLKFSNFHFDARFSGMIIVSTIFSWIPMNLILVLDSVSDTEKANFRLLTLCVVVPVNITNSLVNKSLPKLGSRNIEHSFIMINGGRAALISVALSIPIMLIYGEGKVNFAFLIFIFLYSVVFLHMSFSVVRQRYFGDAYIESVTYIIISAFLFFGIILTKDLVNILMILMIGYIIAAIFAGKRPIRV